MALDPSIILGGRGVDVAGAMANGNALASQTNALRQQNALADLYKTQGAGLIAGDPGAVNALAAIDPGAALGMKDAARGMAWAEEDRAAAKAEGRRAAEEAMRANAASLTAEQIAAEKKTITEGLSGAAFFYQKGDEAGYNNFLTQQGMDPAQFTFADFPAHAAMFEGALEAMESFAPPAPDMTASQKDYLFYSQQEAEAGRQPLSFNDWDTQGKKAAAATNTVTIGTSADGAPKVGPSLAEIQTSVKATTDLIDEIANDPALAGVTGALEGGGGNNVDEFGMTRRAYYGDDGLAVIQKVAQLQNTAWLAARDMLKGGGAITDYESKKAEGAMARLSRAQGDKEFKAALKDLKDAITEGSRKLQEAGATGVVGSGSPVDAGQDEIDLLMQGP